MKFLFHLFIVLSLLILTLNAQAQPQVGCQIHKTILICNGEIPSGEDLQGSDLQTLVMSKLSEGTWLSLENPQSAAGGIQKIEIQRSSLGKVDPGYFASVSGKNKLKRLSFRNVDGPVVVDKEMLRGLEKSLNYLIVTNGLTVNIADLAALEYLTDLELMSTKIIGTPADFEKLLPQLRSLEIKKCNLNQLPWEALAKWVADSESKRLKINDNNWICDCSMVKLKRLQPSVLKRDLQGISELQKITCAGPGNLAGKQLSELTEKDLCPEGEPDLNQGGSLEASGSTSGDRHGGSSGTGGSGSNEIGGSSGSELKDDIDAKESGVRTEVIIASTVIGVLVLAFVAFLIIYKCRLFTRGKSREERASRTHQNKRYVNVIEEPPLQQFGTNGRAKENGKYSEGAPV